MQAFILYVKSERAFRLFLNKQKSGSLVRMKKAFSLSVGVLLYVKVRKMTYSPK